MKKEKKEELAKKWEESGVLNGLTEMDKESPLLILYESTGVVMDKFMPFVFTLLLSCIGNPNKSLDGP